jgi:hypothetical protein
MWILLAVWGCSPCGARFSSLEIEDPDGLASDEEMDLFLGGLADLTRWTADADVCASRVVVTRSVRAAGHNPDTVVGKYKRNGVVLVEAGRGDFSDHLVRHELCHAIDRTRGIVEAHPDLWVASSESVPRKEVFAETCAMGPPDDLSWTLALECGWAPEDELVAWDESFARTEPERTTVQVDWTKIFEGDGRDLTGAWPTFGGVAVAYVASGEEPLRTRLQLIDEQGTLVAGADLGPLEELSIGAVIPWNHGAVVLDSSGVAWAVGWDGRVLRAASPPGRGELVWDDVVFGTVDGALAGTDLWSGEAVELGLTAEIVATGTFLSVLPGPDRVYLHSPFGQWLGTPASGWTPLPAPASAGYPAGGGWYAAKASSVGGEIHSYVSITLDDGAVALPEEACTPATPPVTLDGDAWLLEADNATDTVRLGRVVVP